MDLWKSHAYYGLEALLNIILDLILMKLMEKYTIEGAALATITAQLVQTIITPHYFNHNNRNLTCDVCKLNYEPH